MMVAAALLAAWKGLPVQLIGRLLTGVAAGLAAGTAITYLFELRLRADPGCVDCPGPVQSAHRSASVRRRRPADRRLSGAMGELAAHICPTW